MKILKYVLFTLAGLLVVYILLCFLGKKKLAVQKDLDIHASTTVVFNLVNNLQNTELWNNWARIDTTMKTMYNNIAEGVGASSEWTSKSQGSGKQKIIESDKNSKVRSQLEFERWEGVSYAEFNLEEGPDHVNASWSFEGASIPFLLRGFILLSRTNSVLGKSYKEGLKNLKAIAEKRAGENSYLGYVIQEVELDEKNFVMIRQSVKFNNIQQFYASNLGLLFSKVQKSGVEMDGMPCGLFFKWNSPPGSTDMAAAIPTSPAISVDGASSYSIPAQKALVVDHYGAYSELSRAHDAVQAFMKDKGYFEDPPSIEEYITDPGEEQDPEKILTKVTYYFTE